MIATSRLRPWVTSIQLLAPGAIAGFVKNPNFGDGNDPVALEQPAAHARAPGRTLAVEGCSGLREDQGQRQDVRVNGIHKASVGSRIAVPGAHLRGSLG